MDYNNLSECSTAFLVLLDMYICILSFSDPLQQNTNSYSSHEDSVLVGVDVLKHTHNSNDTCLL